MKFLISFPIILLSMNAQAVETTRSQPRPTTTATTGGSAYVMPVSSGGGGGAADAGRSAGKAQLISAAINVGAAGMYTGVCASVYGSWACPLAAMAGVAASMLGNASGRSSGAGSDMSGYQPGSYGTVTGYDQNGNPTYGDGGAGVNGTSGSNGISANAADGSNGLKLPDGTTPATIASAVAKINADLAKSGAVLSEDGKTMTTKDGRKFDLSKGGAGGAGSLEAMGLTAAEASQADALGKKFAAGAGAKYGAMAAKLGADGGGGGGGATGRSPASDDGGAGGAGKYGNFMDPRNKARAKASVSGLTRKLGDDTIGVSGDNIFEMVTRRYKARDQVNQFLKD